MINDGAVPVEIGKHALGANHRRFNPVGNREESLALVINCKPARALLDEVVARIGNGVYRMTEANNHFPIGHASKGVCLRFVGRRVALLNRKRHFIGAAVLWAFQRADCADDA